MSKTDSTEEILIQDPDLAIYDEYDLGNNQQKLKRVKDLLRRQFRLRTLVLGIGIVALLFLCGFILMSAVDRETIPECAKPTSSPKPKPSQSKLMVHTREYQIILIDLYKWATREETTALWNSKTTEISSYLNFTGVPFVEATRQQYLLKPNNCKSSDLFRVRNYLEGGTHKTTIDIKASVGQDEHKACSKPFWPADNFVGDSFQKCEHDEHYCTDKFSRETRISFSEQTNFTTCLDLVTLFPWAFSNLEFHNLYNPLQSGKLHPWWIGKYSGFMSDTKYEIEFTLEYKDVKDAFGNGVAPTYGEWSIRIFTKDGGLSEEWNEDVVADVENLWRSLIKLFGSTEEADCA